MNQAVHRPATHLVGQVLIPGRPEASYAVLGEGFLTVYDADGTVVSRPVTDVIVWHDVPRPLQPGAAHLFARNQLGYPDLLAS
jgi:hypothetical protein